MLLSSEQKFAGVLMRPLCCPWSSDEAEGCQVGHVHMNEGLVQVGHVWPLSQLLCALAQLPGIKPVGGSQNLNGTSMYRIARP